MRNARFFLPKQVYLVENLVEITTFTFFANGKRKDFEFQKSALRSVFTTQLICSKTRMWKLIKSKMCSKHPGRWSLHQAKVFLHHAP